MASPYKQTDLLIVGADESTVNEIKDILTKEDLNYNCQIAVGLDSANNYLDNEDNLKPNIIVVGSEFGTTNSKSLISKIRSEHRLSKIKVFKISKDDETVLAYAGLDVDLVSKPETAEKYAEMLDHKIHQLRRL